MINGIYILIEKNSIYSNINKVIELTYKAISTTTTCRSLPFNSGKGKIFKKIQEPFLFNCFIY